MGIEAKSGPPVIEADSFKVDTQIVGAMRCGTTSLHGWLGQVPGVLASSPKEGQFFDRFYENGIDWYHQTYFGGYKNELALVDARPQNLMLSFAAARIKQYNPDSRIIIMVRNPILRWLSDILKWEAMRPGRLPAVDAHGILEWELSNNEDWQNPISWEGDYIPRLDNKGGLYDPFFLRAGFYLKHIEMYHLFFPSDQIKVIVADDLFSPDEKVQKETFRGVQEFMGLDPVDIAKYEHLELDGKQYSTPKNLQELNRLDERLCSRLTGLYARSIRDLSHYLNRDLSKIWLKKT